MAALFLFNEYKDKAVFIKDDLKVKINRDKFPVFFVLLKNYAL